jgi:hypothetical protein
MSNNPTPSKRKREKYVQIAFMASPELKAKAEQLAESEQVSTSVVLRRIFSKAIKELAAS